MPGDVQGATEPLLEVRNLRKIFPVRGGVFLRTVGHVHAVEDVSFHLNAGETLGLVGESGCGKSTVGKTLLRLLEPTAGEVWFEGRDIAKMNRTELRRLRRDIQIIFQDPFESLNARHTVGKILEEPFVIHGLGSPGERRERVQGVACQGRLGRHSRAPFSARVLGRPAAAHRHRPRHSAATETDRLR